MGSPKEDKRNVDCNNLVLQICLNLLHNAQIFGDIIYGWALAFDALSASQFLRGVNPGWPQMGRADTKERNFTFHDILYRTKSHQDLSKNGREVLSFNVHLSVSYTELMISSSWCQLLPKYHKVLAKKEYMCHPYLIFVNFCTKPHYSGL